MLVGLGIAPVPALPQVVRDRLDSLYADSLAAIPDGAAKNGGIAAGAAAAAAMLAERTGDGRYVSFSFTEGTNPGEWRRTSAISDPFAWVGKVHPVHAREHVQFRTKGPFDLASRNYAKEYNEVKELGSATSIAGRRNRRRSRCSTRRTRWRCSTVRSGTSPMDEGLGVVDEARFYAQVNVSGADALINCWDDKEYWHFWRPSTAIQNGDADGNPRTAGDPAWTPLVANSAVSGPPVRLQLCHRGAP